MDKQWLWLLAIGIGGLYLYSKRQKSSPSQLSGLGIGGAPRRGMPRTEAERQNMHESRFGPGPLPPRGTGLGL